MTAWEEGDSLRVYWLRQIANAERNDGVGEPWNDKVKNKNYRYIRKTEDFMKKTAKRICSLALGAVTACATVLPAAACGKKGGGGDTYEIVYKNTENDALSFGISTVDGNFNPFFATSASDVTVLGQTQVSMMTAKEDSKGDPIPYCGEDEPTVALNYSEKMLTGDKEAVLSGQGVETDKGAEATYTEYQFLIKNGLKFSDGEPLTIDDVLFNLYVYLDPMYTGSATIYSTKIVGLNAYRTQDPNASDDVISSGGDYYAEALQILINFQDWLDGETTLDDATGEAYMQDLVTFLEKDLNEIWTASAGTQEAYKEQYYLTQDWEIFLYNIGIAKRISKKNSNGRWEYVKDEEGKYITTIDSEAADYCNSHDFEYDLGYDSTYAEEFEAYMTDERINDYMQAENCGEEIARSALEKEWAINWVFDSIVVPEGNSYNKEGLLSIFDYGFTGTTAKLQEKIEGKLIETDGAGEGGSATEMKVTSISGIQTERLSSGDTFKGKLGDTMLNEDFDVLKIYVHGIDPKAIWNFSVTVSPKHYYSSEEIIKNTDFGVQFKTQSFFENVLQAPSKNKLPIGAGAYAAYGGENGFYKNNVITYVRNQYFETMDGRNGAESTALHNANIKWMKYQVVNPDKLVSALATGSVMVGEPSASQDNVNEVSKYAHLGQKNYWTNGYGYVGINPKEVPDIEVRQAMMMAMNTAMIVNSYYTPALGKTVYRSMSTESWAYPEGVSGYPTVTYNSKSGKSLQKTITDLVESAGWIKGSDGVYAKGNNNRLKFVFTIAGETTDHPAYAMFNSAAKTLNACGFDITVMTDPIALKKLARGELAVWAAAWSSSVDPDLYQVYHKDSSATSVENWGYSTILNDFSGQFEKDIVVSAGGLKGETYAGEKGIINKLSELIEDARETINTSERADIYADALDLIMELAVELPTYQRKDLVVYNRSMIDPATLVQKPTSTEGAFSRIWEVNYYVRPAAEENA